MRKQKGVIILEMNVNYLSRKLERIDNVINPWPRSWNLTSEEANHNDLEVESYERRSSHVTIRSKEDLYIFRKYYHKHIKRFTFKNVSFPHNIKNRIKNVKELKISHNSRLSYSFPGIKHFTHIISPNSLVKDQNVLQIIKKYKHLQTLKLKSFEALTTYYTSLRTLKSLKCFYFDSAFHSEMLNIKAYLTPLIKQNFLLQEIGLFFQRICEFRFKPEVPYITSYQRTEDEFARLIEAIFDLKNLETLKLDIGVFLPNYSERYLNSQLLDRIASKNLNSFDIRLSIDSITDFSQEAYSLLADLDYFAFSNTKRKIVSKLLFL